MYTLLNDMQALYVGSTATQARTTLCSILCDAALRLLQAKVSYRGLLNGLTDYRQTAKNITWLYRQNEKKLPTTDRNNINWQPTWSNIVEMVLFRNKWHFWFLIFIKSMREGNSL